MSRQKSPWWRLTHTRGQSLLVGVLWLIMAGTQLLDLALGDRSGGWRWAIAVAMACGSVHYLAAWRVRGQREHPAETD